MLVLFTDKSLKYLRDRHVASNTATDLSGTLAIWFFTPTEESSSFFTDQGPPFPLVIDYITCFSLKFCWGIKSMKISQANSDYKLLQVPPWRPWTEGQIDTSLWPFVFSCPWGTLRQEVTKILSWEDPTTKFKLIDSKSHTDCEWSVSASPGGTPCGTAVRCTLSCLDMIVRCYWHLWVIIQQRSYLDLEWRRLS